jgi:hypothetical protein
MIVAIDNSVFTAEAIHEVWITMGISIAWWPWSTCCSWAAGARR